MSYAGPVSEDKPRRKATPQARRNAPREPADRIVLAAGILAGIAVGAGIALLLAPQSGADTRHALARRGRHWARRSRDAWDDLGWELRRARKRRRRRSARSRGDEATEAL